MTPVLVTRSEPDASESVAVLSQTGIKAINAATSDIVFFKPELNLTPIQALTFTSRNGVRAFCQLSSRRDLPVYVVGDATDQLANEYVFKTVYNAKGDGKALTDLILSHRLAGPILHGRGEDLGFDLTHALQDKGLNIHSEILYRAQTRTKLSKTACEALQNKAIVLIYSQKGAERFIKLVEHSKLEICFQTASFIAISKQAAQPLINKNATRITLSQTPDQQTLVDEVQSQLNRL